jgi:UDP-3-O-acyl-N-acetylglucosamine deacetylase
LDALGDLVTLGQPLMGHVVLYKAGHDVMNRLVRKILESSDSYRVLELGAALPEIAPEAPFVASEDTSTLLLASGSSRV